MAEKERLERATVMVAAEWEGACSAAQLVAGLAEAGTAQVAVVIVTAAVNAARTAALTAVVRAMGSQAVRAAVGAAVGAVVTCEEAVKAAGMV